MKKLIEFDDSNIDNGTIFLHFKKDTSYKTIYSYAYKMCLSQGFRTDSKIRYGTTNNAVSSLYIVLEKY